jgi:hypothetical protein
MGFKGAAFVGIDLIEFIQNKMEWPAIVNTAIFLVTKKL